MKRITVFFLGALVIAGIFAAFSLGKAMASTGCFSDTNTHWAETYICWLKDNGIASGYPDGTFKPGNPITRAEVAVMLKAANGVPPQSGVIVYSAGNSSWQPFYSLDDVIKTNWANYTDWYKPTVGVLSLSVQPDFTPVLYGKNLEFMGVDFCYSANANAFLTYVEVDTLTTSNGLGSIVKQYFSDTNYVGDACRFFAVPTPVMLTAADSVVFYIKVDFAAVNNFFEIGRTTFFFQPTGTSAFSNASINSETVILEQGTGDSPFQLP